MMAQWHKFFGFISCVTDHKALITGSDVELIFFQMDRLSDIGTLLINSDNNDGSFVIHTDFD